MSKHDALLPRVLVIGVGNCLRGDDAVGLEVALRLRKKAMLEAKILEHQGEVSSLIDAWLNYEIVILIDATSSSRTPGSITCFNATETPLPAEIFDVSTHSLGVAQAVELARVLGKLPKKLIVIGIEGAEFGNEEKISTEVEDAIKDVVLTVEREVELLSSGMKPLSPIHR